ncbi:MAG: hypothetical protein QOJ32_1709 [Frankiaceae bacterium]|jgi:hypothetical protein|nr:hypothetical protein [Frankiaceae bacterium]MDQ1650757.1 hypothetical protein [Frankiaceae bacterium]
MWSTMLVKRRAVDLCRVGSCLCSADPTGLLPV